MPVTRANGTVTQISRDIPAAAVSSPGTSRPAWPCRSPWRPAHQRAAVEATAARAIRGPRRRRTRPPRAAGTRRPHQPTRSWPRRRGTAAAGRRTAGWRAGRPAVPYPGPLPPDRSAGLVSHGMAASGARALTAVITMTTAYPAFPASQTPRRQRHDRGQAGDDSGQADPLAAPVRGQGRGHQGSDDDGVEAEADAAGQADRDDRDHAVRAEQGQRRPAEQQRSRGEHPAVAITPHQPGRGELGQDGGQHERAGHHAGLGAAGACRHGVHRCHRQQQVEAGQRAKGGQERQGQAAADQPGARRPAVRWPGVVRRARGARSGS